jgi:hypothetical protein
MNNDDNSNPLQRSEVTACVPCQRELTPGKGGGWVFPSSEGKRQVDSESPIENN